MARYDDCAGVPTSCGNIVNPQTIPEKLIENRRRMDEALALASHVHNILMASREGQTCEKEVPNADCVYAEVDAQRAILCTLLDELRAISCLLVG